jgi:hypothetical protein
MSPHVGFRGRGVSLDRASALGRVPGPNSTEGGAQSDVAAGQRALTLEMSRTRTLVLYWASTEAAGLLNGAQRAQKKAANGLKGRAPF